MRVFISWSGDSAERVAAALGRFLGDVLAPVTPFVSSSDIEKGSRWNNEIARNLDLAGFGIVCIMRDRLKAPWLNFEAGALSRSVNDGTEARVATLLIDIDNPSDVPPPLGQFQSTLATRDEVAKLVLSINQALGDDTVDVDRVNRFFEWAWSDLDAAIKTARSSPDPREDDAALSSTGLDAKLDEVIAFIRNAERKPQPPTTVVNRAATNAHERRGRIASFQQDLRRATGELALIWETVDDGKGVRINLDATGLTDEQVHAWHEEVLLASGRHKVSIYPITATRNGVESHDLPPF